MEVIFYRDGGTFFREVREVKFVPDAQTPGEYKLAVDGDIVFSKMTLDQKLALESDYKAHRKSGIPGPYEFITKDFCSFGGGTVDKEADDSTNSRTNRAKSGKRTVSA